MANMISQEFMLMKLTLSRIFTMLIERPTSIRLEINFKIELLRKKNKNVDRLKKG